MDRSVMNLLSWEGAILRPVHWGCHKEKQQVSPAMCYLVTVMRTYTSAENSIDLTVIHVTMELPDNGCCHEISSKVADGFHTFVFRQESGCQE